MRASLTEVPGDVESEGRSAWGVGHGDLVRGLRRSYLVSYRRCGVEIGAVILCRSVVQDTTARAQRHGFHALKDDNLVPKPHPRNLHRTGTTHSRSGPDTRQPALNPVSPSRTPRRRAPPAPVSFNTETEPPEALRVRVHTHARAWRRSTSRATPPASSPDPRCHPGASPQPLQGTNGPDTPSYQRDQEFTSGSKPHASDSS